MINKNDLIRGVKWTTISTLTLTVCGLLKVSILTRFLDTSDFGIVAIVMFFLTFLELFNDMGLTSAILHKKNISKNEYSSLYWLNLIISITLCFILIGISPLIAAFYNSLELKEILNIISVSLLFTGIGRQFKVVEQKHLLFKKISIIEILSGIFSLGFSIILVYLDFKIYSLIYSYLLQQFMSNILFFIFGIKKHRILFRYKLYDTKPFLSIGLYQLGGQVVNYFNKDLDVLIIGKFFGTEILGGYSLAKQLVLRPTQIINPIITKVASPTLAKLQANIKELRINYLKLVNVVFSINFIAYVIIFVFTPIIVKILYGPNFGDIIILVRLMCLYMLLRAVGNPIGSLVIATGKTKLEFYWNWIIFFIMPLFIYIGALISVKAVIMSMTICMIVLFYPSWRILVYKMTEASFKEYVIALIPFYFLRK